MLIIEAMSTGRTEASRILVDGPRYCLRRRRARRLRAADHPVKRAGVTLSSAAARDQPLDTVWRWVRE